MPRQSVADLLSEADQAAPPAPAVLPPRAAPPNAGEALPVARPGTSPGPRHPARRERRRPRPGPAAVTESQTPKWKRLERKELRLRADQLDDLARLRRSLNRQRGGEGERITENTLIRVAVDVLLTQSDRLRGSTEDELRESVAS
jgi:hypothetical protein